MTIDVAKSTPLHGAHLIEASAGTGKTFALAGFYLRAIIEKNLSPKQILVVTFTEAAAQELRDRLRRRVRIALFLASQTNSKVVFPEWAPLAEIQWVQDLLIEQTKATPQSVKDILQRAVIELDEARISTIHGFCQRVLLEHGWRAQLGGVKVEIGADEVELSQSMAIQIRREILAQENIDLSVSALAMWPSIENMAQSLRSMMSNPSSIEPNCDQPKISLAESNARFSLVARQFATTTRDELQDATATLYSMTQRKILPARNFRKPSVDLAASRLANWAHAEDIVEFDPKAAKYFNANYQSEFLADSNSRIPHVYFQQFARYADEVQNYCFIRAEHTAFALQWVRSRMNKLLSDRIQSGSTLRYQDLIELTARLVCNKADRSVAAELAQQFPLILVDEFQDTDLTQWAIFRNLHMVNTANGMILVGDPKQAIYGFRGGDIEAYLYARTKVISKAKLTRNFRSHQALVDAVQQVYASLGSAPFKHDAIQLDPINAADKLHNGELCFEHQTLPPLRIFYASDQISQDQGGDDAFEFEVELKPKTAIAHHVAREIKQFLNESHAGLRVFIEQEQTARVNALAAKSIAVLVHTKAEVKLMVEILQAHGIASVSLNRDSIFSTAAANDWLLWLAALTEPNNIRKLRAALATQIFVFDPHYFATQDDLNQLTHPVFNQFHQWSEIAKKFGPLAALQALLESPYCASNVDGLESERTQDWLQLAEHLQSWTHAPSLEEKALCLQREIRSTNNADKEFAQRLHQTEARVPVMTVHASKGLEFDLVYLPFATCVSRGQAARVQMLRFHRQNTPILRVHEKHLLSGFEADWLAAKRIFESESLQERLRVLYVGMTRARHAVVLGVFAARGWKNSALGHLICQFDESGKPEKIKLATVLPSWTQSLAFKLENVTENLSSTALDQTQLAYLHVPPPELYKQQFDDWRMYSFSALTAGEYESRNEAKLPWENIKTNKIDTLSGNRFGRAVHAILEHAKFAEWQHLKVHNLDHETRILIESALRAEGVIEADLKNGAYLAANWMQHLAGHMLPEGTKLGALARDAMVAEFEFHFPLDQIQVIDLIELLRRFGFESEAQRLARQPGVLDGLMHGYIDLVYQHQNKFGLIDFKTNLLEQYDPTSLEFAMQDHAYRLQGIIYGYALRRWLQFRFGVHFSAQLLGSMNFIFLRGLPELGVYSQAMPLKLFEAMDDLFEHGAHC